jgi:hypothetical protein
VFVGGQWRVLNSGYAFPESWQTPARTEQWAYEQLKRLEPFTGRGFAQVIFFPWATLIDLLSRNRLDQAGQLLDILSKCPPKSCLVRATVCQHIWAKRLWPYFLELKITDVFWSHAVIGEDIYEGIRIHPFPLFPVRCIDGGGALDVESPEPIRQYLYSFMGAYDPGCYLTPVRRWLFELPYRHDALVIARNEWHFESLVYGEQIQGDRGDAGVKERLTQEALDYGEVLRQSVFSLCPSGSGPNTIRLWESLGFGAIPVILSDSHWLPGTAEEWADAVIRVQENQAAVAALPQMLTEIAADSGRLARMRQAGQALWIKYGLNGPRTVLSCLTDTRWIARSVGLTSSGHVE